MNYTDEINSILQYIEENYNRDLDIKDLAGRLNLSPFYFHRIFKTLVGLPPYQYLEARRMAHAQKKLMESDMSILEIALGCGFRSHSAFTRVFKRNFNVAPGYFRRTATVSPQVKIPYIAPVDLQVAKGRVSLHPQTIRKTAFTLQGLIYSGADVSQVYTLWSTFFDKQYDHLVGPDEPLLGVCWHHLSEAGRYRFTYMAGFVAQEEKVADNKFEQRAVPANEYSVFPHDGPISQIDETFDHINRHWVTSGDFHPAMDLDILWVRKLAGASHPDYKILIPIK